MTLPSPTAPTAARGNRAVVLEAGGASRLADLPRPVAGRGEILLALRCCGLCGTDIWKLDNGGAAAGSVLGHEVVGTVVEVGPGVLGFRDGDRVAAPHHVACGECDACRRGEEPLCADFRENQLSPGGFSDLIRVGERAVRHAAYGLPDHLSDEAAVFLEPGACVLRGIHRSRLGELIERGVEARAAILGAGSMGLLHLLLLKALWPALRVTVVDPLPERRRRALDLGADADAADAADVADVADVAELADVVFDTAGGAAALAAALDLTRPGGTTVLFAHAAAGERAGLDLNSFFKAERRLLGTYSSSSPEQREVFRLLVTGRIDPAPLVTHRIPLSRFAEAGARARERRALKVLLTPDAGPGNAD
ncbi:MAG: L-iditol 2-dehydrogenase, partial [Acidobacteriota bacterium]|nr:L-iditol 2-dehydrogenase [Acidobacteriota bacterium]